MINLFHYLTLAFATISLSSFVMGLFFSWQATNPNKPQEYVDNCSDSMFQCYYISYYTVVGAFICGCLWGAFECFAAIELVK